MTQFVASCITVCAVACCLTKRRIANA